MSGGVAYLLDLDPRRVNTEMVDLDPLDDADREFLRSTVERHLAETGSAVAERLLADWESAVERFGKVMPQDYKRVLAAMAQADKAGAPVEQAIMAASHG
jgi:glutamate synthase (NADPH/NADH) large chain